MNDLPQVMYYANVSNIYLSNPTISGAICNSSNRLLNVEPHLCIKLATIETSIVTLVSDHKHFHPLH